MSSNVLKLPFYIKAPVILVSIIAVFAIMHIAKSIIVPLIIAVIISIVLHPVVNFFVKKKCNRFIAIIITLIIALIVIATLGSLIISQAGKFTESWPKLVDRFTEILNDIIIWISAYFNISTAEILAWIDKTKRDLFDTSGSEIGKTLIGVGTGLALVFIMPVYVFMLLFYQPILIEFIRRVFDADNHVEVNQIIAKIKTLIQRYLIGLLIEIVIIATLFSVGLLFLGIEYAIILGVIGAFLNLIPYIGAITGAILPMMVAVATKPSPWYALLVLALYIFVQFIDNSFVVPKIVASKVKINALVTIIAVFSMGALWGIAGMVIAIPLLAIVKLICDHVEPLKPWGFLLGDTMPPIFKIKPLKIKKIKII